MIRDILIIALGISLALKIVKVIDLAIWSLTNFAHGKGLTNFGWTRWTGVHLPRFANWIDKRKQNWIYKVIDMIF